MTKEELADYFIAQGCAIKTTPIPGAESSYNNYEIAEWIEVGASNSLARISTQGLETLQYLDNFGIIVPLVGDLILSEKSKELVHMLSKNLNSMSDITLSEPTRPDSIETIEPESSEWPEELLLASPQSISSVVQAMCGIPSSITRPDMFYVVNNLKNNLELSHLVHKVDGDYAHIEPQVFLDMLKKYYSEVSPPMAFRSLFVKSVLLGLYDQYLEHKSFSGSKGTDRSSNNQTLL